MVCGQCVVVRHASRRVASGEDRAAHRRRGAVFRVAQMITGDVATGLLAAAIFGLMPAHVEAVVWASSIPEPLTAVFELGALVCPIGRKPGWWSRGMLFAWRSMPARC
jgi:hypothetical protein